MQKYFLNLISLHDIIIKSVWSFIQKNIYLQPVKNIAFLAQLVEQFIRNE